MPGCKSLSDEDISNIDIAFDTFIFKENELGKKNVWHRNKAIFYLQLYTGFRISELCSLKVKQVVEGDDISYFITVPRGNMKGGKSEKGADSRTVELNDNARSIIRDYLNYYINRREKLDSPLFSPEGSPDKYVSSRTCQMFYHQIFEEAKIKEYSTHNRLSTHSCRKTFAEHARELVNGDIKSLQEMMGHKSMESTSHYIEPNKDLISNAWKNLKF